MSENGKPPEPSAAAVDAALANNAAVLKALQAGCAAVIVVNAPLVEQPGGGYGPDLERVNVLAPQLPKFAVSKIEAAVELWADVMRKQADASRLVGPGGVPL